MKFALIFACAWLALTRTAKAFVLVAPSRFSSHSARTCGSWSPSTSVTLRPNAFSPSSSKPVPSRHVSGRPSSSVTMAGLFGLGAPEIAVCLAVAAVILGPDKLGGFAKDVGKMAGELKDVPAEFQAGIVEGEKKAMDSKSLEGSNEVVSEEEESKETA